MKLVVKFILRPGLDKLPRKHLKEKKIRSKNELGFSHKLKLVSAQVKNNFWKS